VNNILTYIIHVTQSVTPGNNDWVFYAWGKF